MNWSDLWAALALMLVFEGITPFLSPARLRETMLKVVELEDSTLRGLGVLSMFTGLVILYVVRS